MTVASDRLIVGTSKDPDPFLAGAEAAKKAKVQLQSELHPHWILAFSGGRHDPEKIHAGIQSVFGDIPIVGGCAVGIITSEEISYTGYECGIALFCDVDAKPMVLTANHLDKGEFEAGKRLGEQLRKNAEDNQSVIVFYDSVRSVPPPVLNVGSLLMDGLYEGLGEKPLNIFGAGLVGDLQYSTSFLFDGKKVCKHAAMAIVLPSTWLGNTTIMHGCTPLSNFLEITRIEGPVIYELEGRPALDVLMEKVSPTGEGLSDINFSMTVALGVKYGDLYASFDESSYVSRLIMDVNPENGSVTLFEADFKMGQKVQIMSRNNQVVLDSVHQQSQKILDVVDPNEFRWAFYIDCAGRTSEFCGAETEEATILQEVLDNKLPLFGFYSGVELAPFLGRTRPLDWSGVLTVFTRKR
jgi:hypothetical protein